MTIRGAGGGRILILGLGRRPPVWLSYEPMTFRSLLLKTLDPQKHYADRSALTMRTIVATWLSLSALFFTGVAALAPIPVLLKQYATDIQSLQQVATQSKVSLEMEPYSNEIFFLRYCIQYDTMEDRVAALKENLAYRQGPSGKAICQAALTAVQQATASTQEWDNDPVLQGAPHSNIIQQYLTPINMMTVITPQGNNNIIQCIRAGQIDDVGLMKAVSESQMVDFFLYAREVQAIMANRYSSATNNNNNNGLWQLVTANDLTGVKLIGGSSEFRSSLAQSSALASKLYPATSGPTLLLNLPPVLNALVQLFTPLFPEAVKKKIRFAKCDSIKNVDSLMQVSSKGNEREKFVKEIETILKTNNK